jgi:flagellar biosynthesis protein FlhF
MTVKRFVGATARECLRKVKEELGPDAIVVSNKAVAQGVEIVAMSADSLEELSQGKFAQPAARPAAVSAPAPLATPMMSEGEDDYRVILSAGRQKAQNVRPWFPMGVDTPAAAPTTAATDKPKLRPLPPRKEYSNEGVMSAPQVAASLRSAASEVAQFGHEGEPASPQVAQLMDEMKLIKSMLERQLAGFAFGEMAKESPNRVQLLSELLDAGFSGQSSRRMIQEMPADIGIEDGRKWIRSAVNRRLRTLPAEADFIDQGGVYALVGPTGVGKTTTTAKLAARCVVRYGAERLALLTTDGYRIGAHEQLRIYGRILGVPVFVVRDGEDLRRTLADLRDKHMVLIDTVGMSQRDRMVAEQAAMLTRSGEVRRLLVLNAGARGDTLDDVVRAYAGEDLAGCILSKVDEAASLAPALDCIVRHGLTLAYVANGQRVPEDLHLPNRNYLMHRAFKLAPSNAAHRLSKEEVPLAMPTGGERLQGSMLG